MQNDILTQVAGAAPQINSLLDIKTILQQNAFAQGGLLIGAVGFLVAFCRQLPAILYRFVRQALVVSIEIEGATGSSFYKNRILRNISEYRRQIFNQKLETDFVYNEKDDRYKTGVRVGIGDFYAKKDFWMKIIRIRQTEKVQLYEFVFIETFFWNKNKLIKLIDQLMNTDEKTNNIYINDDSGEWEKKSVFRGKSWDGIVLQPGVKEKIMSDLNNFIEEREWFVSKSAPHQRGYCFWGAPGTGKTSIASAIATTLNKGVYILHLSKLMTDKNLAELMNNVNGVVLIEDIDAVLNGRKVLINEAHWTFSGLLNAINGVNPDTKTRIIVMTSNHPENLDPALLRPGRIDQVIKIDGIGKEQAVELFRVFHSENLEIEAGIREAVGDRLVQPVILREVFINQKRDLHRIPAALKEALQGGVDEFSLQKALPFGEASYRSLDEECDEEMAQEKDEYGQRSANRQKESAEFMAGMLKEYDTQHSGRDKNSDTGYIKDYDEV
jgi:mitochondrial chaperone BCS1